MSARVGIIGTGVMGKAVATRLLTTGHKVAVYNRTQGKAESLKSLGAIITETPKALAEVSDLVITVVKDAMAVETIGFGNNGIVHGKHDSLTVADMSTINPIASRTIAKRFMQNGVTMLDIPVMGGPKLAEKGELVLMVGGSRDVYEKHRKVFDDIGNKIFYLGDNGTAHAMKLALNLQIAMLALALSEGITLTKGAGLKPELFLQILNSTYFKTGMSENKGPKMIKDNFEATFTLKMMKKDLDTINEAALALGISLPMASLADKLYRDAAINGFSELDYTGILAYIEKASGLKK
ncbi:MAG: NAD(P)-dependent oxidoreductase [Nitrososphaerales archaeon]